MGGEAGLIEAAKQGSVVAFTQLVHAHRERLLRFLLSRSATHADAEDALQETLINAYRYLHSYDARWRFSTWLYRIAINNLARLRREPAAELGDIGDDRGDPLRLSIAESDRQNLWLSARRLLSEEVFTAMWLRYVEEMSVREIAGVLERSVSWTKVNLMRARQTLQADFNDEQHDPKRKSYG